MAATVAHLRPLSQDELRDAREHPYIVVGNLVQWLVSNRASLGDVELGRLFDEVERHAAGGTEDVRELIAEGFVEDLQNTSSADGIPDDAWQRFLGPETERLWRLIQDLWAQRVTPEEYRRLVRS
ncbi:MAG TPA: hypothetical protein VGL20_12195 [Candidatus Dormibacteraeota bacterium]|jgi:hypothetical protein